MLEFRRESGDSSHEAVLDTELDGFGDQLGLEEPSPAVEPVSEHEEYDDGEDCGGKGSGDEVVSAGEAEEDSGEDYDRGEGDDQ